MAERTCNTCGETKPADEFYARRASCKACVRQKSREYHDANREKRMVQSAAWRERNLEQHRENARAYYRANKDRHRLTALRWSRDNPDYYREFNARWYRENRDHVLERIRAYRAARPDWARMKSRLDAHRYAARKAKAFTLPFTADQLAARLAFYGGMCWICHVEPGVEVDHVKPLSKGGPHILANLRPACRSCNGSKSNRWPLAA
jgi:5-methylcytosine-specific restriction endonuclease McrA